MILCSPQPTSIIKAALLAALHNDLPGLKGEESALGLFSHTAGIDADREQLADLISQISARTGIDAGWLAERPGQELAAAIAANLRYRAPDRTALIFAAAGEALAKGHAYCLSGIGDISRLFLARAGAVSREVHKMLGFIRFHPAPDGALATKPKLFHNTADLILRRFAPRYPGTRLVALLPDRALALEDGQIFPVPPEQYLPCTQNDPFVAAWEKYYRSQYIETRKNISLVNRHIPKKYRDWLDEGRIIDAEAQK